ncbi:MAG: hypothetical protein KKD35_07100 [Elusimicrobia bacterium]|nr:hypothetical protein [Elusimicrobiota bacterium]
MKLNIGCGYNHLKGYTNIDSSKDSLADKIMPAQCFDIESDVALEIKASHLIEHLGFFRAKYFLSEAFRTLKAGGSLIIETPHAEKSFENFSKGNKSERESVLGWIYGSESEGMNHMYCFPVELMEEMMDEAGFEISRREYFNYHPNRPVLRFTMKKNAGLKYKSLMAEFRHKLLIKKIIIFKDEYVMSENENILKSIEKYLINAQYDLILNLSINNSLLVNEFFKFAIKKNKDLKQYFCISKYLKSLKFECLMYEYLMKEELGKVTQQVAFDKVTACGIKVIEDLLSGEKVKLRAARGKEFSRLMHIVPCYDTRHSLGRLIGIAFDTLSRFLRNLPREGSATPDIAFEVFSFSMTKIYSQRCYRKGLKELNMDNFKKAEKYFNKAIRLDRDNLECLKSLLELKKQ